MRKHPGHRPNSRREKIQEPQCVVRDVFAEAHREAMELSGANDRILERAEQMAYVPMEDTPGSYIAAGSGINIGPDTKIEKAEMKKKYPSIMWVLTAPIRLTLRIFIVCGFMYPLFLICLVVTIIPSLIEGVVRIVRWSFGNKKAFDMEPTADDWLDKHPTKNDYGETVKREIPPPWYCTRGVMRALLFDLPCLTLLGRFPRESEKEKKDDGGISGLSSCM